MAVVARLRQRRFELLKALPLISSDKAHEAGNAVDALVCAEYAHRLPGLGAAVSQELLKIAYASEFEIGPAYSLRGLLHLENGHLAKALKDAERAITLGPAEARAFYVRGRVRFERMAREALDDLNRAAVVSRRQNGLILHALAAAQLRAGHHDQALATQREALKLRPRDADVQEQLKEIEQAGKRAKLHPSRKDS
jgi:tetratricopeptide (TPR) repeat protein